MPKKTIYYSMLKRIEIEKRDGKVPDLFDMLE
jgi:hypothetical protein